MELSVEELIKLYKELHINNYKMTCMQYIAFDFETSGLPTGRRNIQVSESTYHNYDTCRAVSLSAARFSSRGRLVNTFDAIILPTDFTIGEESQAVHGITQEFATKNGRPFVDVFDDFMKFIGPRTKTLVAHNAKFDEAVLRSEMIRHNLDLNLIKDFNIQCTLELYQDKFLKPIKLVELYKDIYGVDFDNAHNSLADCIACGKVYPHVIKGEETKLKNIGIPKIIIGASSVASAIGLGFKKQPELVEELWKKYKPLTFKGKTKDEIALDILDNSDSTRDILKDVKDFKSESSEDVSQKLRSIYKQIENVNLPPNDMISAKDYIRKVLYTNHGTRNEYKTAEMDGAVLIEDPTFYKYDICEIEGTLYQIVGRVDRIQLNDNGTRTLVEIKNRAKGLFMRVRDYEDIQCQVYLQMLDDIQYCRLVEQYNEDKRAYLIEKNNDKWNNYIIPKLVKFCEHLHNMLST